MNSSTKTWRVRPLLQDWNLSFSLIDPYGRIQKEELSELLEFAGMMIGIGDNRKNDYGKFEIESLEELQGKKNK